MSKVALIVGLGLATALLVFAQAPSASPRRSNTPYAVARAIVDGLPRDRVPAELRSKTPVDREAAWPGWVADRDRDIRARLAVGDEDSVFNLTLFGTTF